MIVGKRVCWLGTAWDKDLGGFSERGGFLEGNS